MWLQCDSFAFAVDEMEDELNEPISSGSVEAVQAQVTSFNDKITPQMEEINSQYAEMESIANELTVRAERWRLHILLVGADLNCVVWFRV